ncbi:MAG: hypothetical protein KDD38_05720 [Bdellovibrionales bacterium]|nr:hypothetical protein [Bdellovibrionales bacterium]
MRELGLLLSNYLIFTFLAIALAAAQASLWFHVFGTFSAPYLWLLIICYWTLYRSLTEAVLMTYIVGFTMITMSGVPLSTAFAVNLSVFGGLFLLRDRVLWSGINSFILASGMAAAALPVFTFIWSNILEPRSISDFHFFEWVLRAPLTALFAFPFFYFFSWIDKVTHKEAPKDAESGFI